MKVLKFGGTSVGTSHSINQVIKIIKKQQTPCVVVISAVGGITNLLLETAIKAKYQDETFVETFSAIQEKHILILKELNIDTPTNKLFLKEQFSELKKLFDGVHLIEEFSNKTSDKILSYGELLSSFIVFNALKKDTEHVGYLNAQEVIVTESVYNKPEVLFEETNHNIKAYFKSNNHQITIVPGFISKSKKGEVTTLGRGGSDYSAAIFASALEASILEIWTDVSGMYTTNPKLVKQAKPIEELSYEEAMELSHFGAKVLYPPTIQPVLKNQIQIQIKNTFSPEEKGTLITKKTNFTHHVVRGISNIDHIALMTLEGPAMIGVSGFAKRIFEALHDVNVNIIVITQASSEHSICFAIDKNDINTAEVAINKQFAHEIFMGKVKPLIVESGLSIVAVVGDYMKNHQGISGTLFSTLGANNINIRAIAQGASEKNITVIIKDTDVKKALNSLHEVFFEHVKKQLNVFIAGVGNVGKQLLNQIQQQNNYLKEELNIKIRVVGITNSKTMCFDTHGINLKNYKTILEAGETANIEGFLSKANQLNLRNSVFVDITANETVAQSYANYLKHNIAVVACNKIACSCQIDTYKNLKYLSKKYNAPFLFETNVGAGLPIINTLNNLITSGDKITGFEAVLSGSLNFVFNHYNTETSFYNVVKQAKEEGYTEPDPRIDLSGIDVARKLLILLRESGFMLEIEDIENESFLKESHLKSSSVSSFFEAIKEDEAYFKAIYQKSISNNTQLKYVAQFKDGKAKVGLQEIPPNHPFYNLQGKDNIVMFYTQRYPEQPLIVKGAGAGADVTASGLFADIIKCVNR